MVLRARYPTLWYPLLYCLIGWWLITFLDTWRLSTSTAPISLLFVKTTPLYCYLSRHNLLYYSFIRQILSYICFFTVVKNIKTWWWMTMLVVSGTYHNHDVFPCSLLPNIVLPTDVCLLEIHNQHRETMSGKVKNWK